MTTPEGCFGGLLYVPAPSVQPHPFGILSVAEIVPTPGDVHWQQGVMWEPVACEAAALYGHCNCVLEGEGAPAPKTPREGTALSFATPFTVVGSFQCSPVGRWNDGKDRATDHLLAGEERAVELEMALGGVHSSQAFATDATNITPTPGTPVTIAQGIALLELAAGSGFSGQGVLLMSRREALLGVSERAIQEPRSGDLQLVTGLRTPVAALAGYNGVVGPTGNAPAGQAWLFAISRPRVWRSEVFYSNPLRENSLDTAQNNLTFFAERTYVVGWDCGDGFAVLVENGTDDDASLVDGGEPVEP